MTPQNRRLGFRTEVNPRSELPALRVRITVITEITAICEYLDETAKGGESLLPVIALFRNDPATIYLYKGNRIPIPEARVSGKVSINQLLNRLDDELESKMYIAGDRFSAADIHLYGLLKMMVLGDAAPAKWVLLPERTNVLEYFKRMDERPASKKG
ncbi:hypothetical protein ACHAQH_005541 [Verticillium albo-atrum]